MVTYLKEPLVGLLGCAAVLDSIPTPWFRDRPTYTRVYGRVSRCVGGSPASQARRPISEASPSNTEGGDDAAIVSTVSSTPPGAGGLRMDSVVCVPGASSREEALPPLREPAVGAVVREGAGELERCPPPGRGPNIAVGQGLRVKSTSLLVDMHAATLRESRRWRLRETNGVCASCHACTASTPGGALHTARAAVGGDAEPDGRLGAIRSARPA